MLVHMICKGKLRSNEVGNLTRLYTEHTNSYHKTNADFPDALSVPAPPSSDELDTKP